MVLNQLSQSRTHISPIQTNDSYSTNPVIQDLVLLLQARHEGILRQIILPTSILFIRTRRLFLQCLRIDWHQAVEIKIIPFFGSKCRAFVEMG